MKVKRDGDTRTLLGMSLGLYFSSLLIIVTGLRIAYSIKKDLERK
jgi:hypothetical protein